MVNVGTAVTPDEATGVTVIKLPTRTTSTVDIRGGVPGTVFTPEWLMQGHGMLDAIVLSGGSVMGFGAIHGVSQAIYEDRGGANMWHNIPLVSGAIIFDSPFHRTKSYPGVPEGRRAYANAGQSVPTGPEGAGRAATIGKLFAIKDGVNLGQAAKYVEIGDLKILVVTVLNSVGGVINPNGKFAPPFEKFNKVEELKALRILRSEANTTITAVIINHEFPAVELKQMARQIHMALGSVIQPFATMYDGDVLFLASTNEVKEHDIASVKAGVLAGNALKSAVWELVEQS